MINAYASVSGNEWSGKGGLFTIWTIAKSSRELRRVDFEQIVCIVHFPGLAMELHHFIHNITSGCRN